METKDKPVSCHTPATVALAAFMEVLDTSIANVALPHIAGDLGASTSQGTWVLTSYLVPTRSSSRLVHGRRCIGRKKFFLFALLVSAASFLCGIAPTLPILLFARVLQGVGGGGLQPMAQAIMADSFEPKKRGQAFALYGLVAVLAPSLGPTMAVGSQTTTRGDGSSTSIYLLASLLFSWSRRLVEDPPWIKADNANLKSWITSA